MRKYLQIIIKDNNIKRYIKYKKIYDNIKKKCKKGE